MTTTTARRGIRVIGPDSANLVDVYIGDVFIPALDVDELGRLVELTTAALTDHPQAGYVVGPDGRFWCPPCAEGGPADECDGHGCPGDSASARQLRAEASA